MRAIYRINTSFKRLGALLVVLAVLLSLLCTGYADVPREETPDIKVAFYASNCYNMIDENGKKYGYGYDMMQQMSNYMQCTFSYVGYEKTPGECVDMLRNGELDIYTAAKITPEREEEFVFSKHPAITSTTCMNVKAGDNRVTPGDYSTYNGLRVGLLERHTYNDRFIEFTKEKGFECEIVYYSTPTELSNALIDGEVDALVNSYNRTPEDEMTIENFGETPYYFMARKEEQELIDQIDAAIDRMNIETPNWRNDLYDKYYGSQNSNIYLSEAEKSLLRKLQEEKTTIRAVMRPDNNPYSWYDDGKGCGIVADIFEAAAKELELDYELVPVSSMSEYMELMESGSVDLCLDMDSYYDDEGEYKYKMTKPYLATTVSVLRRRGSSGRMSTIGVLEDSIAMKEIILSTWQDAQIVLIESSDKCITELLSGRVDCVLMMSYAAQKLARDDAQNRLTVDIVPGVSLNLKMGVNSKTSHNFFSMWEKTITKVSENKSDELVQRYLEETNATTLIAYLFDHPAYLVGIAFILFFLVLILVLYIASVRTRNRQLRVARQLSEALEEARSANDAKLNFFSKMSHDIRTPLNVVLGMTQIAKKYKHDQDKLSDALENITTEGNYLLSMINSILDVNQLEHGSVELICKPFKLYDCMLDSVSILKPLADKKEQELVITTACSGNIVVGDAGRLSQIMVNIISNAIKYTDNGGRIEVGLEALPDNWYRFTCRDNGIGMKPEFIKHICEDYSRAEDSRTSTTEGTGLGMAVVKGFTELMNGKLRIESEFGKGSTFIVELPLREATKAECELLSDHESLEGQSIEIYKGRRVLLAEDNALNAEIAAELLQSIGLIVETAANGELALERFEQSKPYEYFAIFMDMQMPVMNGIEATRKIRESKREDRDILIFAMTANTLTSDRQSCKDAGMDGYISKPVNIKDIKAALNECLNKNNN